jgi:hypothetical protein
LNHCNNGECLSGGIVVRGASGKNSNFNYKATFLLLPQAQCQSLGGFVKIYNMTFYNRFNIKIDTRTAQRRFVNRLYESIFQGVLCGSNVRIPIKQELQSSVAYAIGEKYSSNVPMSRIIGTDFYTNLLAAETVFNMAPAFTGGGEIQKQVDACIRNALNHCETDISLGWDSGRFFRKGAEELDQALVNEPIEWINKSKFISVRQPFEKAIKLFLEAQRKQELSSDVITNAYESLEALVKIITKRNKDLSANADIFLKTLSLSQNYKPLVKEYLKYANHFRHGMTTKKEIPKVQEVESFLYLTGLFIRLATSVSSQDVGEDKTAS